MRTLGCQMNVHDSERLAGLLAGAGYVPVADVPEHAARATAAGDEGADILVVNTCSVRENAATRLFGNLGQLAAVKRERPGMQIAVAGCLAQQMRGAHYASHTLWSAWLCWTVSGAVWWLWQGRREHTATA